MKPAPDIPDSFLQKNLRTPKKHISPDSKNEMKSLQAMGNNYLNSGESIILTTHSVSVDGGLYDILLTNERIVFVDNRYTRFEPLTLPFTQIISVKGGRVPTGEPVITLVLTETGVLADSRDQHLIFTQQPGEERRHERDQWVKRLIELVISARQHAVREETAPHETEPGVKPSVRRWLAPDHIQPRTAPEKEPARAKTIVEPDVMELPEFLFEEMASPGGELTAREITDEVAASQEPEGRRNDDTAPPVPVPGPIPLEQKDAPSPVAEAVVSPERVKKGLSAYTGEPEYSGDILADMGTRPAEVPGKTSITGDKSTAHVEPFSRTVLAAITAIRSANDNTVPAVPPGYPSADEPGYQRVAPPVPAFAEVPGKSRNTPPAAVHTETGPMHGAEITGEDTGRLRTGEVNPPADYDPEDAAMPGAGTVPADKPRVPHASGMMAGKTPGPGLHPSFEMLPGKRALSIASLAVLGILILAAGVVLFSHFLSETQAGSSSGPIITPVITVPLTVVPALGNTSTEGVRVRVVSPGTYTGTIGNPGFLHQVSGSGDQWYTVLKNDDLVSATIRKQDDSGSALTVGIYNNGTLLTSRTVTAPRGEIMLLIDPKTGSPPGIIPVTIAPANATGATTLTYI